MRVLVTRIEPAATRLATLLRADGFTVDVCPALAIAPLPSGDAGRRAAEADAWVFVSAHAVEHGWSQLCAVRAPPAVYAVGPTTAAVLRAHGGQPEFASGTGSAEQLLTLPALQSVVEQRITIVRGKGGLSTLSDVLTARGATVSLLEVYERVPLTAQQLEISWHAPSHLIASSADGVSALLAAADAAALGSAMRGVVMLVPSARVAEHARALGVRQLIDCAGADDESVRAALRSER